jgi:hypothetical protein
MMVKFIPRGLYDEALATYASIRPMMLTSRQAAYNVSESDWRGLLQMARAHLEEQVTGASNEDGHVTRYLGQLAKLTSSQDALTMKQTAQRERKYYGCKHCGSWCVVTLSSCIGDRRDGIRSDYQCRACGGVYGSAAHGHVFIDADDWYEETGEKMPKPDKERKLAMEILIVLEEQFNFRFRSRELKAVEAIAPLIKVHHENLLKTNESARDRLEQIGRLA